MADSIKDFLYYNLDSDIIDYCEENVDYYYLGYDEFLDLNDGYNYLDFLEGYVQSIIAPVCEEIERIFEEDDDSKDELLKEPWSKLNTVHAMLSNLQDFNYYADDTYFAICNNVEDFYEVLSDYCGASTKLIEEINEDNDFISEVDDDLYCVKISELREYLLPYAPSKKLLDFLSK